VTVIKVLFCALVLSVATMTSAAAAQEPPPVTPPPSTPPATPPPAVPPAPVQVPPPTVVAAPSQPAAPEPLDEASARRRRREIKNMEGVLQSAVKGAAFEIASELETPETGKFQMSGSLGAQGFNLDGYGVFFHVAIPGVQPTFVSPMVLEAMRQRLAQPRQAQPEVASSGATGSTTPPRIPNADAEYVARVKDSLMRAMIQYSKPLELRPDEWLTVAAGDGDEPMMPAVLSEQAVMLLRISGRDIAEYMAGRLTLNEVLKKVEVKKF
jgi:hypothetical protein